ncbi:MAG: LysM peptidoglycan-binding domain-containing protein [Verrucomicrobia bacterium]|nr:LysM peptidoglycan-binding domain-containing protein [Verrucomicrobiota bacterium]
MKPYRTAALIFASLSVALVACQTTGYTQRRAPVEDPAISNLRADMRILEERINKAAGDVQALQVNYERLHQEVASVRQQIAAAAAGGGVAASEIQRLDSRINAVDNARKHDAEVIINQVTAELQKIGAGTSGISRRASSSGAGATPAGRVPSGKRTTASPGAAGASAAGGAEQGYEHTIEKGQSLSAIAKAYNTTVDALKKANNLKGDTVYIGQKLFIPKQ